MIAVLDTGVLVDWTAIRYARSVRPPANRKILDGLADRETAAQLGFVDAVLLRLMKQYEADRDPAALLTNDRPLRGAARKLGFLAYLPEDLVASQDVV